MTKNSLENFIDGIKKAWGPLTSNTVANCQSLLKDLANTPAKETWLADLLRDLPEYKELYRDPEFGFMLIAYSEHEGLYRVPHNHGSGWVIYAVQSGEVEMGTFTQVTNQRGEAHLVRRESYRMQSGDCKVYLPGDIHETRCISNSVLMLRLTSCDLKKEDSEGRMIRFLKEGADF